MIAAAWPRDEPERERLLHVDPRRGLLRDAEIASLPRLLREGDLLVLNDAATLPASFVARTPFGPVMEVRLAGLDDDGSWWAVLFGGGDWRMKTEDRARPPVVEVGEKILFLRAPVDVAALSARIVDVSPLSPRLVRLRFDRDGEPFWRAVYALGRPIQYSYVSRPLALWHVQTTYAARPWAMEPPSAGRPLTGRLLIELKRRRVDVARLTHAAGLSSTGDPALDGALPLPERFEIPSETVAAVARARGRGGRIVAVGTTVVRALEGRALESGGALPAGPGRTSLRIDSEFRPRIVDGVLTGVHQPGESHFDLLGAFASQTLLGRALAHAEAEGYLAHEFGDSMLVLPD